MLEDLIRVGALPIADEADAKRLVEVASTLAQTLGVEPHRTASFFLAAADVDGPANGTEIAAVQRVVEASWSTFGNRYAQLPKNPYRMLLWEVLSTAAKSNAAVKSSVVLTARSAWTSANVPPDEATLVAQWLLELENQYEATAEALWTTTRHNASQWKSDVKIRDSKTVSTNVRTALAGSATGEAPTTMPQANHPPAWGTWADSAADGIGKAISDATNIVASTANSELNRAMADAPKLLSAKLGAFERRQNILWWRESQYSVSRKCTYGVLAPIQAAIAMAHDLAQLCVEPIPRSVEAILRRTYRDAFGPKREKTVQAKELATLVVEGGFILPRSNAAETHQSFGEVILAHSPSDRDIVSMLGARIANAEVTLADLSVWIFRDILICRATAKK